MNEEVFRFGPNNRLTGILTTPDQGNSAPGPIAVVCNAGIVHHIGPFRLHVRIARMLARIGISTLRLDLSGLGDSAPRTGKNQDSNRAVTDIVAALNQLTIQTGIEEFVMIGLCSGAFNSHLVTVADKRVKGAVFIDGIVFPTFGFFLRHHVGRLFLPRFWRNVILRRMNNKHASSKEDAGQTLAEAEFFGDDLCQQQVSEELASLKDRGTQMLFVYTEGFDDVCGRSQFKEMYGLNPDEQIQVEYYAKAEHTFRLEENRNAACQRIASWLESRFVATNQLQTS